MSPAGAPSAPSSAPSPSPDDDEVAAIGEMLAQMAPRGVATGVLAISDAHLASLHPEEAAIIATAVPKRRREFATGRALLRSLLPAGAGPVMVLTSRAPRIPDGVVASLAHDGEVVIAAVGHAWSAASLGVDVERVGAVDSQAAVVIRRGDEADLDPTLVFVAKEAAYKAWSNSGGSMLEHHEMRISCPSRRERGAFIAEVLTGSIAREACAGAGKPLVIRGMVGCTSARWLAVAMIDAAR